MGCVGLNYGYTGHIYTVLKHIKKEIEKEWIYNFLWNRKKTASKTSKLKSLFEEED